MSLFKRRSTLPPIELLDKPQAGNRAKPSDKQTKTIFDVITRLKYDTLLEVVHNGPRFYQYRYKLQNGCIVKNTTKLARAIAQELDIDGVRVTVESEQNGRLIIEVPKTHSDIVYIREALESPEYKEAEGALLFPVGKQADGTFLIADMHKLPHILAGGMSGSGMNAFMEENLLVSLLYRYTSDELRLLIIDPKQVQFPQYNGIPHLLQPVITEPDNAKEAIEWVAEETERRFKILNEYQVRDIDALHKRNDVPSMPFIMVIIGELADLMMLDGKYYEKALVRIIQKSRAVGIYFYIATHRPSTDVCPGVLRANLPTKLAFATATKTDSKTLLDMEGGETLKGAGDLLYFNYEQKLPIRLQAPHATMEEVDSVIEHIKQNT